ncbi:MAG: glucoamylase family protein [Rhodanobacteraceae bacterium]
MRFTCDYSRDPEALPHFWEYCVGSGHATLALRADWQAQLKQCHEELGFRHIRFHGILDDDMGTVDDEKKELLYSFHNADQIYDFLRSIQMRPIVELSFMPRALASSDKTTFHYKANVTPPADYGKWATLVSKLAGHWIDRYGAKEVSMWPIEVWNEPNMDSFWTGSKEDYFRLFETTHKALKHVHPDLTVGGPVTAQNAWIDEFVEHCEKVGVPPDFISTHTYPTDALGSPDDDTKKTLSKSHLGILRERAEKVRKQAGKRPLYYTEWCTSSNPRDELHDDPYAAAYITQAMLNMGSLVDAYSYWTFSDIFEENYFPSKPFQGGFGLMNIHGIPKPAYRAYEILHGLGEEKLPVQGSHETVQTWVVRGDDAVTVVIVNLALPLHPIKTEKVNLEFLGLPGIANTQMRRIDANYANAKAKWKMQGEPRYPSPEEVRAMIDASRLQTEDVELKMDGKTTTFEITVQPQSVTAIELRFAASKKKSGEKSSTKSKAEAGIPHAFNAEDEKLLDTLQSAAFRYFTENTHPKTGLVADSSKKGSAASIASTGFALSCYPIAVERGWLSRDEAVAVTLRTLKFFAGSRQGEDAEATGHKGFYYHFLDMRTGKRAEDCELSTIDTAMLLAGMVVAGEYFDRKTVAEKEIRSLVKHLFDRVEWRWTLDKQNDEVNQSWKPGEGFKKADWEGYTEALVMYVMGAASPSHPLPRKTYQDDAQGYEWRHNAGLDWIHATPLFIHLFPQAWIDLRGLDDGYVSKHGAFDYFQNTQRAIAIQRVYAYLNPYAYAGYGKDVWGLSACAGPDGERKTRDGKKRKFMGYAARGVTHDSDDGTLVPWAATTCLAHEPEAALAGLHALLDTYPHALREGQFVGAINPSLPGDNPAGWIAPTCFGLDQGLVVMMIENARSGFIWELTRNSQVFSKGLKGLGFKGRWLE